MKPIWQFVKVHPGDKIREPIQGEFFSTDAIRNPAEALVREGIQNSLDASHDGKTVLVRIYFSGENDALSAEKASRYFEGAWDHFRSERTGLVDVPNISDPCRFFAFEDFGTTWLQGDPQQWEKPEIKEKNDFFIPFVLTVCLTKENRIEDDGGLVRQFSRVQAGSIHSLASLLEATTEGHY